MSACSLEIISHLAVFFSKKNQPDQPHFNPSKQAESFGT
jgi:hypothetical protein